MRRRADSVVIALKPFQCVLLQCAGEEQVLERIELFGDVVVAMKIVFVENLGEDFFRQDVLDQHLPHIVGRHRRIDSLLRVFEEFDSRGTECCVFVLSRFDHRAEGFEDGGQVPLELRHRLAELDDLLPLIVEKEVEQIFQTVRVVDQAAAYLPLVLNQNCGTTVLEDDVVLRIALAKFLGDFLVEVILFVLGLPIAKRQPYIVKQRSID